MNQNHSILGLIANSPTETLPHHTNLTHLTFVIRNCSCSNGTIRVLSHRLRALRILHRLELASDHRVGGILQNTSDVGEEHRTPDDDKWWLGNQ